MFICVCVCTLAYAQRRHAAVVLAGATRPAIGKDAHGHLHHPHTDIYTIPTRTPISAVKKVHKLLAEAPRGLAGFPPYNGGG